MPPPKLYLNEHLSPRLAEQLRQHGFDVKSTLEADLVEADDDEQLSFAVAEQRALVTFNHKDFVLRHEQYESDGKQHWGIVLSTEEPIGLLRRRLLQLLNTVSVEELKGHVRWLNDFK